MREVFVMTRHAIRNYGSVLQAFATQTLLREAGTACTVVDYRQPGVNDTAASYLVNSRGVFGGLRNAAYRAFRARDARRRGAVFESFIQGNLNLTPNIYRSNDNLHSSDGFPEEGNYCVGSDQVWNVNYNVDNRPYYLEFAPQSAKRFSFCSSIGMSRLPPLEEKRMTNALREFSGVSVRESNGADYLNSLGIDAQTHVDPTLAVPAEAWSKFGSAPLFDYPYLLVYQLNSNPELQSASLALGKTLGLPVVRIEYWKNFRGGGGITIMRPQVEEFVALFRDAEFVVTDSFHGVAFSASFDKQFVAMPPPKYASRIDSFLNISNLGHRRASSRDGAIDIAIQEPKLPSVSEVLNRERESLQQYTAAMVRD